MSDWRVARSLETLRDQVNAQFPGRDKGSDGTIGNESHQATKSDHNPNAAGVVTAMDITHDPAHGLDARKLAEALVASRDPRIKYLISNAQIINSKVSPWVWRPYTGVNDHRHHVHVSVIDDPALYDDTRPWAFPGLTGAAPARDPGGHYRFTGITATEFGGPSDRMSGTQTAYGTPGAWWDKPGVALPARISGARQTVRVRNIANGLTVDCPVMDVGPWNTDDPYWSTGQRPQAETGTDHRGRTTNHAGIDLTPAAARAIGLEGKGMVDWDFVQELNMPDQPTPPTTPSTQVVNPLQNAFDGIAQELVQMILDDIKEDIREVIRRRLLGVASPAASPPASLQPAPAPQAPAPQAPQPAASGLLSTIAGVLPSLGVWGGVAGLALQVIGSASGLMGPVTGQGATGASQILTGLSGTGIGAGLLGWAQQAFSKFLAKK